MALTNKQQAFVNAYLKHFNGTRAAIEAGYTEKNAASQASNLMKNPNISEAIHTHMRESVMDADEVLHHLREIAVGLRDESTDEHGNLDLLKIKQAGKTHLIKSFKQRSVPTDKGRIFETEVEPVDRTKALELIGKNLKMFTDKVEVTGEDGKPIPIAITKMDVDEL